MGWPAATRSRNVERAHLRGRYDHYATVSSALGNAPRIFSEAAVVGSPLSTISADPETFPLSIGVSDGNTDIPAPGKGVDATVTAPDE